MHKTELSTTNNYGQAITSGTTNQHQHAPQSTAKKALTISRMAANAKSTTHAKQTEERNKTHTTLSQVTHPQLDELVHPLHRRKPIEAVLGVAVPHKYRHHRPELYERGRLNLSAPAARKVSLESPDISTYSSSAAVWKFQRESRKSVWFSAVAEWPHSVLPEGGRSSNCTRVVSRPLRLTSTTPIVGANKHTKNNATSSYV